MDMNLKKLSMHPDLDCFAPASAEEKEYVKHDEKSGMDVPKTRFLFSVTDNFTATVCIFGKA